MEVAELTRGNNIRLLLTGGGTGGHLFPAVATAQEFQKQFPGTTVLFVGTKRKVDTASLLNYGYESKTIDCHGVKGKNIVQLIKAIVTLPRAYLQALRIIKEFRPDVILGVGGYVTGPVVSAGKSMGIPAVIHEQNSVPGLANRKLGAIVNKICLSLPGSGDHFDQGKIVYTGNPVRSDIRALAGQRTKARGEKRTILILGGSQGAKAINEILPSAIALLGAERIGSVKIIHQVGDKDVDGVRDAYKACGVEAVVEPFFRKMELVYSQADLVVSRAGATTLAELSVLGKPAILIPYPYAADNHQEKNGQYYVLGGGALQFQQKSLTAKKLGDVVAELLFDETKLMNMSAAMKKLSFPDAPERIVACCLEQIKGRR
ncbi:undecaprenyldiphospho-muramoylpentapeptide beta-N-acetylglucosaminyltransferase [Desulforhopalus sp. IMCC35007]|uniref:undecaprenyldiphospho-muramoylpentapeptide beta-N-acetylglucosaminyltransferase n=1 Tax=Desulforhopalus sp. IMCC35007 TaxID=2569543 RepID=UPI0010AEA756|nr:undecaprenyldiphospho-muramoylpentapeptide beta-N-acetylglucosaminyltransferase [Desulforhopalus sp. IMCC35007]TKB06254.1 undecaprenyldiphospho-muramoylpentapeptide beta-N-acetylglucosaminyltransferase [Desulforhopalus sp. IMCC35007]